MSWTIPLPYKRPPLSLNDRGQTQGARAKRSQENRRIRQETARLIRAAHLPACERIHVRLHWQPPDRRRRDPDNLVATLKPIHDGIVDAGVVRDDAPTYLDWSRPVIHTPAADRESRMWLVIERTTPLENEA